jgi:hypothetical protein
MAMEDKHVACHVEKTGGAFKTDAPRTIRKDERWLVETSFCRERRPAAILWRGQRGNSLKIR